MSSVVAPARRMLGQLKAGAEAAADPIVDRLGDALGGAGRRWEDRPGARVRRVRAQAREPLASLYGLHPGARTARPVEIGLRSIDVERIAGTAVGGGDQRGGDFLPLKPFRGANWQSRWQRLRSANDRLVSLPPIEVLKFDDGFWVLDGHNRVALALYAGQPEIDASVVELVSPGARRTEPLGLRASSAVGSLSVRAAGSGQRPSRELAHEDDPSGPGSGRR
ncbi:MAG: hypothetical protein H0V74_08085 [Chloroflexi bacterium]|nr:hypothetical protein [Chloroflexota bacterium]